MPFDSPRLIADIGGQFARFALETSRGRFEQHASLRCRDHAQFQSAVQAYLSGVVGSRPLHAAVAIANPVDGDLVKMTNYHWQFSIEDMRRALGFESLVVVNDFTALAMAVPWIASPDLRQLGGATPRERSVKGILGAGTGLGVSGLIPAADGWVALGAEGGHASFAPRTEAEVKILRHAWKSFEHVSFERLISGPGLELIYEALAADLPNAPPRLEAQDITRLALEGHNPACDLAIDAFCALLGTAASNLAVTLGAKGGIYIGGSIVPKLGERFDKSPFRARFDDKGRFSDYLRDIPVYIITASDATFSGAAAILDSQLKAFDNSNSAILVRIQRTLDTLSPAERRVGLHVLAHSRKVMNDPIAEIAQAAEVSQPTVIRFCRSLGCVGLSDFKLKLASGLTATLPVTHAQVTVGDSVSELSSKVLGNTASAILQERDKLNRESLARAIDLLDAAQYVEFHAIGHGGVVALDAQFKFLRFGLSCAAYTDPRLQSLAAMALRPNSVVVIISSGGRMPQLLAVADAARARGAGVISVTASHSPLAKKSDVALIVDHSEDVDTHVPMVSRILQLLVIDVLAVGVAMRRSATPVPMDEDDRLTPDAAEVRQARVAAAAGGAPALGAISALPGVAAIQASSASLTSLTSHSR